jgi:serine/threonine-protein kinase
LFVVGETIAGRYEVEELVGHGGMSSVYKARDALLERHVALKILHEQYNADEDFVERFKREARSVAQLQHPNIVTVIDRARRKGASSSCSNTSTGRTSRNASSVTAGSTCARR